MTFSPDYNKSDFLLPYKSNEDGIKIRFSALYLLLYALALHQMFKNKNKELFDHSFDTQIKGFPECFLELNYLDMADKEHHKKFKFSLNFDFYQFEAHEKRHMSSINVSAKEIQ